MKSWINRILILSGFILCMFPLFSSIFQNINQSKVISTYFKEIEDFDPNEIAKQIQKARAYNESFYNGYRMDYESILNFTSNGMMGQIEIPKIQLSLPIYHGVNEDVLSIGAGHLPSSSFPVGGTSTRSILTGHTGLASAKLFTRLDELEKGDLFYIYVGKEVLAYKVKDIQVIEPEQLDQLEIIEGCDIVSLVTCTPYGINTHRLVINGYRTDYQKKQKENIKKKWISNREMIFVLIPAVLLLFYIRYGKHYENN